MANGKLFINYSFNQSGQMFILAVVVLGLLIINTLVIIGNSSLFRENSTYSVDSLSATDLAEAGVDKAVATLNAQAGNYTGEAETTLGDGTYEVSVTSVNSSTKLIQSTGYIPNKANQKVKRTVSIQISIGVGSSFNYGIQTGDGGLVMTNGSEVIGSVYTNGNISMTNNSTITGDAYVAGGIQPSADQQSDCSSPNCSDFIFGKVVNGQNQLDVAQSFTPSNSSVLNKVSIKLKKFGNPSDLTVRILGDSGGKPNKQSILTSGTLSANLVGSQYGFTDVVFASPPSLQAGTTYWLMIAAPSDSNNYWAWSEDVSQGYNGGKGSWSSNWQSGSPVWNLISADLGFKTYMGGVATYISGANGAIIGGNAHANTLQNLSISKGAYYQVAQNITAGSLHPGSPDPTAQVMPISDSEITDWKDAATSSGVHTGDINSCPSTLSAGKYIGSINLPNGCTVTVDSPIWVTGSFNLTNTDTIKLDSSFGTSSGVVIVDGASTIANGNKIQGSGTAGSYLILISTYDTEDDPLQTPAFNITNNGNSGILYANLGEILINNNNSMTSITAWKLYLSNNVIVTYDQGLAGAFFSSGPGGSFSVVKGTYQVK